MGKNSSNRDKYKKKKNSLKKKKKKDAKKERQEELRPENRSDLQQITWTHLKLTKSALLHKKKH